MRDVLDILLINAAGSAVLALLVFCVGRWVKRPAVMHVLWLLVLVKLLMPPVVEVGLLPRPVAQPVEQAAEAPVVAEVGASDVSRAPTSRAEPTPSVNIAEPRIAVSVRDVAVRVWLVGSVGLAALALVRLVRLRRWLVRTGRRSGALQRRARSLARRLGIRGRGPRVREVSGRLAPMLWGRPGRSEILLPATLLERLGEDERDALLAHELAHFRRRDHWVRWVELAALALFWWNPVAWWARRNLRHAEERSCDALVLEALPGVSRCYAAGLLKTLEFLNDRQPGVPALATGALGVRHVKERMTMILDGKVPARITLHYRIGLAMLAAVVLLLFPAWADRPSPRQERAMSEELQSVRERELLLQLELERVTQRRLELEHALGARGADEQAADLRRQIDELREQGRRAEADELAALLQQQHDRQEAVRARIVELERELLEKAIALERAAGGGDRAAVEQLQEELMLLQRHLEREAAAMHERRERRTEFELQDQIRALDQRLQELDAAGDTENVDRLLRELDALIQELDRRDALGERRAR